MRQGRTSAVGAGLVLALLAGMAALTWLLASWTWDAWQVITTEPVVGVDAVLGVAAAAAGTVLGGWLLVSTSWCTLSVLRGLQAPALTPLLLRRLVVLLLGVGLAATASPGYAATAPQAPPAATATVPGWQPTGPSPVFRLSPQAPDASGGGTGTPWVPSPPPGAGTPEAGAPQAPAARAPQANTPQANTPAPTPEAEAPKSGTPEAEAPKAKAPKRPRARTPKAREADGSRQSTPGRGAEAEAETGRGTAAPPAPAHPAPPAADAADPELAEQAAADRAAAEQEAPEPEATDQAQAPGDGPATPGRSTGDGTNPAVEEPGELPGQDPAPTADTTEPAAGATPPGQGAEVVVAPGDTLWDIAARALGPGATNAQIARAWPAWYATNLETVGPDPDRIFPGQRLRPPA